MARYKKAPKVNNNVSIKSSEVTFPDKNISSQNNMNTSKQSHVLQTMDQHRAKFALDEINKIKDDKDKDKQKNKQTQIEVRRYVNSFPAMIRMNGLGQALAFYTMKGESHKILVDLLQHWLCISEKGEKSEGFIFDQSNILTAITQSDMQTYMAAQNEALELLEWLKKFALAFLEKDETNPGGN